MSQTFDFLIIGEDVASLCAAAAAARSGAAVCLLRANRQVAPIAAASFSAIPNFVWRRFDLQEYGLELEPISARVTLGKNHAPTTTLKGARETQAALSDSDHPDQEIWAAFADELVRLDHDNRSLAALSDANKIDAEALNEAFADARSAGLFAQLSGPLRALLEDYFSDPSMKLHISAHALARTGLGGEEAATALAALELFSENAWPMRIAPGGPSLQAVLESLCEKSGVEMLEGQLLSFSVETQKTRVASISGDQTVRTRRLFFATPEAAAASGAVGSLSPLSNQHKATVVMRLTLNEGVAPPAGDESAIFQIADDLEELDKAAGLAASGRLPERLPVEFEFSDKGELIARSAYCPAFFKEEDSARPWTGQDRQVVAARMKDRLTEYFTGLGHQVVKTEVNVIGAGEPDKKLDMPDDGSVIIQPHRYNAVAGSLALIDKALDND